MNQLPYFNASININAQISIGQGALPNFGPNPFGNCCNSMLGQMQPNPMQMMSSMMQSMMGMMSMMGGSPGMGAMPGMGMSGMGMPGMGMPGFGNPMASPFGAPNLGPIADMFRQFQAGQYGGGFGNGMNPPCYGNSFGGLGFGGFGSSPDYMSPHGGHSHCGAQSGCGDFNHGHQCPPSCCDRHCEQGGQLQQDGEGKPITYTTSGGYKVAVNGDTINITDPNGENTVKTWGDPHENVNGKHVKDWKDKQRSIVLGDGTKITMSADNPKGVVDHTSIYDGNQNIQIQNKGNQITSHSYNPWDTLFQEMGQYDGETALFTTAGDGSANYRNIYNEDTDFNIVRAYEAIATTGGRYGSDPGHVHDHYEGL